MVGNGSEFGPYAIKIMWNLLFNWADIDSEFQSLVSHINEKDWV